MAVGHVYSSDYLKLLSDFLAWRARQLLQPVRMEGAAHPIAEVLVPSCGHPGLSTWSWQPLQPVLLSTNVI